MSEGKEIKFKFVVDEQSAQRVNKVLDDMIKRAQDLAKTLQGVGGGGGGIMGGGTVGGKAPTAQSTITRAAGTSQQKVSFAQVLGSNVDMFKKMADSGTASMKVMGDAVTRGIGQQQREIFKLQQALDALVRTYDKVGGAASGAMGEKIQNKVVQLQSKINQQKDLLGKLQSVAPKGKELMPEVPWPKAPLQARMAGGEFSGALGKWLGPEIGATAAGRGIMGAATSAEAIAARGLGVVGGLGVAGSAAVAGGAIAGYVGADAVGKYSKFQFAQSIDRVRQLENPLMQNQQLIGGMAMKLRQGDLSDIRAAGRIEMDPEKRQAMAETLDPTARKGFFGTIGGWGRWGANRFSAAGDAWDAGGVKEMFGELFSSDQNAQYHNQAQKKRYAEHLQHEVDMENPIERAVFSEATQNAGGKMAMMRALRMGGRTKTGQFRSNAERFLNARNQFDPGVVQGALSQIWGAGASSKQGFGAVDSVLQAEAAGMTGMGQVAGVMSRQGGGMGADFVNRLRSLSGSGVDVGVSSLLGQYVANAADQQNIGGFSGAGTLGALSFGTNADNGNMIARQNIQGMQNIQNLYSGNRDAFQKAVNFQAAMKSAPDAGYYAQQYLATKLDANRMAEIQSGDFQLTAEERQLGVTEDMLKNQAGEIQKTRGSRIMAKGFKPGSNVHDMAAEMAKGGNIRDIAKKMFGGDKDAAIETYASLLRAQDPSGQMGMSEAMGTARMELYGLGRKAKKGGKMVGDPASTSAERVESDRERAQKEQDLNLRDAYADKTVKQTEGAIESYKRLDGIIGNTAITNDILKKILEQGSQGGSGMTGGANTRVKPK